MSDWKRVLADCETNGLYADVTKLHCLCILSLKTQVIRKFSSIWKMCPGHEPLEDGLQILRDADRIFGHNWIGYDGPVLEKLVGLPMDIDKVRDTLLLAQMIWPEIKNGDMLRFRKGILPGKLIGSHSLKAWGIRLGEFKGDFGESTDWAECTPEMVEYCAQDLRTNFELLKRINAKVKEGWLTETAITLENRVAELCGRMTRWGFPMDMERLADLYTDLTCRSSELITELQVAFPPIEKATTIIPKVNNAKLGYVKGVPFIKRKMVRLNPRSREQIAEHLMLKYGWQAPRDGRTGKANLDDDVLKTLTFPEIGLIRDFLTIEKALGMCAAGKNGWLKLERAGRLHPRFNTCGAVTGRMTHATPNIAQVPKVQFKDKKILRGIEGGFGYECRQIFTVPKGWAQVGVDMAGLELRCLAHFLAEYDGGEYIETVLHGDVHTVNQLAAGLPTRDAAKTFIYAFL